MARRAQNKLLIRTVVVLAVLFVLLILSRFLSITAVVLEPVQRFFYTSAKGINSYLLHFESLEELETENNRLQEEVNRLSAENIALRIYREENIVLRESLNFFEKKLPERSYVLGRVIAQNFNNKDVLVINKGESDGLTVGLPVIVGDGVVIGKVFEVGLHSSSIRLLRDLQSLLAVRVLDKSQKSNLLTGEYGLSIVIELIPHDVSLQKGDIVITAGIEEFIPEGLLVGHVERVEIANNTLFQSAIVQPAIDYDEISLVSILLPE